MDVVIVHVQYFRIVNVTLPKTKLKNKRLCKKCLQEKDISEFYLFKKSSAIKTICKVCEREQRRKYNWKYRDGIDPEEAEQLRNTVDACEICGVKDKILHIDHIHGSSKIRGVLCFKCNAALGNFNDSKELLNKAIEYLGKEVKKSFRGEDIQTPQETEGKASV